MKVNNTSDFGTIVKNHRKKLGYTPKYISEFTGLSVSFISDLENGKSTIEIGKAFELVKVLGVNIELIERG